MFSLISIRLPGTVAAGVLWLAAVVPVVMAANYQPPSLDGFVQHVERDKDGDGDGVKETHITQYLNPNGDSVVSMSSQGRIWAWSLETRNNSSGLHNYVIRDSDCDDQFDEIYGLDDNFYLPDCMK